MSYTKHPNKYIGAHVSAAGGVEEAPLRAGELGARAFAFFLKNQRQWQAKPYTEEQMRSSQTATRWASSESISYLMRATYII